MQCSLFSEVCFGSVKQFTVLCNTIITLCFHHIITVDDITFQKLKAILNALLRSDLGELLLLTLLVGVVSKHLTIFDAHRVKLALHCSVSLELLKNTRSGVLCSFIVPPLQVAHRIILPTTLDYILSPLQSVPHQYMAQDCLSKCHKRSTPLF